MGYENGQFESILFKNQFNPYKLCNELKILKSFLSTNDGQNFIKALKRLIYINKDLKYQNDIDIKIFQTEEEVNLYKCSQIFTKFEKRQIFLITKNL